MFFRTVALLWFVLACFLQGCGGGEAPAPPQASKPAPQGKPEQKQVTTTIMAPTPEMPTPERLMPENYTYDAAGRPDPFKSILLTGTLKGQQFLPPLQQRDVSELRLIAVIWGGLGRSAMLQTPDGKGYTVRVGTRVGPNQGVVKKIAPQEVIVEERYTDVFGETKTREIILELRSSGEKIENE